MDFSSPLAAISRSEGNWLQPTPLGPNFSFGPESPYTPRLDVSQDSSFFDLDMSMEASPTDCLAADLSQNFHIDKTPAFPTPRRSLFSSFDSARPFVTTPPLPSSPACSDIMELSPLPHKPIFVKNRSKLSEVSPVMDSPCQMQRKPSNERKKLLQPRRPSQRTRLFSQNIVLKSAGASKLSFTGEDDEKPFKLGNKKTSPIMALDDMFTASPEVVRVGLGLGLNESLGKPRMPIFRDLKSPADGSPLAGANRRTAAVRDGPPRKIACRRSLSMYNKAEDVISPKQKLESKFCAESPSQVAARESQVLPCFGTEKDVLKRITRETMIQVLDGKYAEQYDELKIVDCRFEYEYEGGHIAGAININSTEQVDSILLSLRSESEAEAKKTLLIFHCEYSAHRAPRIAHQLRSRDRQINMHRYPTLFYPEVYILDGGYSGFFAEHKERCEPQNYVGMDDSRHKALCEREMGKFRKATKFGRAMSYTFGANVANANNDSPSARRAPLGQASVGVNGVLARPRSDGKRHCSY
ncbi:cell division cycle- protein [Orbilia oligospora]|uniref:M-phase inducer phosphatase n=1 Tax=Orbilia oligospora TaxID=2813651 RepID=A0A7C8K8D0_ORBOL|nr:cell division cycle- protein [Orbilia oligospora]KAF3189938.1 cell division cycle- protein [Orbilia oligospora]KAF3266320.1 cell division cycle- protein [Orbilia oligospora]KAF3268556.1 cell division cycle- protein [Orbilia oligospora]KAF3297023.1 cell division cycle- protein [Orbilia oligospora]